jgi:hypothetical protein
MSQKTEWSHSDSKVEVKGFEARHYDLLNEYDHRGNVPVLHPACRAGNAHPAR